MATETLASHGVGEEGFTLIEVLVAMLILAVGLLGLEALGIGAARSITRADRQDQTTMAAVRTVEMRIQEIRRTAPAVNTQEVCATDPLFRSYVCSRILTRTELASLPEKTARIAVTVRDSLSAPVHLNMTTHVLDARLPPSP